MLISLLITVLIMCLIFGLLWYATSLVPAPFGNIARIIIAVIMCIWLIYLLVPIAGHPLLIR